MAKYTGSHAAPPKHAKEKAGSPDKEIKRNRYEDDFGQPDERRPRRSERSERPQRAAKRVSRSAYDDDYKNASSKAKKKKTSPSKRLAHVLLVLITLGVAAAVGGSGVLMLFSRGPSEQLTKLFVRTFNSTGTKQWVPHIFMNDDEISRALDAKVDTSYLKYGTEREAIITEVTFEEPPGDEEIMELIDVAGANWRGKMLIVRDPSLVKLATPDVTPAGSYGSFLLIKEYCEKYGAIAGITGGGFRISSAMPHGFTIIDGKVITNITNGKRVGYVGFTEDHRLITEVGLPEDALAKGVVNACCWFPVLISEGIKGTALGGGYSARSCIGQRADGTILLLVIEGRSLQSLGASYQDAADFLYDQGCINAMNLDSGRSSVMVYNGENITSIAIGAGIADEERKLPNAFVVLPEGANG